VLFFVGVIASPAAGQVRRSATIHWQRVPLADAIGRLEDLFDESVFLDRRVDLGWRVSLDIEASSMEEVLAPLAAERNLGVSRLGRVVYFGPRQRAQQLPGIAAARIDEATKLPQTMRNELLRKRQLSWPRLTEPRGLVRALLEENGWRLVGEEMIPHDLWPAGQLPELTLAEQITLILIGFDLTYELHGKQRAIAVEPLVGRAIYDHAEATTNETAPARAARLPERTKQLYTLRVEEQPVGVVLRELVRRLNWPIDIDEDAIRAAGRSLDTRVSFAVDKAEQDELLRALLQPAGLSFRRDGERIKIVPRP
jgi:hypothetical protein